MNTCVHAFAHTAHMCMCAPTHSHIHIHTYICIHNQIHIHTLHIHACARTYEHMHTYAFTHHPQTQACAHRYTFLLFGVQMEAILVVWFRGSARIFREASL